QSKVPGTDSKASLTVSCEDAKNRDGLRAWVSADYSVIDTSASSMTKWRFDDNKAGTLGGWDRSDDGDILFVHGKDAMKFVETLAVTRTLLVQVPMFTAGRGSGYPVLEFNVVGLGQKLEGHCGFHAPTLTQEQSNALQMDKAKENSEAAKSSPAAAAALAREGRVLTPQELAEAVKAGRASKCAVITSPPGAEVFIDGNRAGVTPFVFILSKRDTPRVVTVKMDGYKTVEKQVDPDGTNVPLALTLVKEK
ncbi:MAG TPA: PEGA domain-containing protein, partial [Verrucomicrobiae bacterium]|nr:PEGA domain-containing protein [Verrucomicrobiae bacterium]